MCCLGLFGELEGSGQWCEVTVGAAVGWVNIDIYNDKINQNKPKAKTTHLGASFGLFGGSGWWCDATVGAVVC